MGDQINKERLVQGEVEMKEYQRWRQSSQEESGFHKKKKVIFWWTQLFYPSIMNII
jgi:hypothetical protein